MSKRENVIIMLNKLKTANTKKKNLQEEFEEVYKDLKATREETEQAIGQAVDKRTEEMQEEMANILAKAIAYMANMQDKEAFKYLIEQYEIIKKNDLSANYQGNRQITRKNIINKHLTVLY